MLRTTPSLTVLSHTRIDDVACEIVFDVVDAAGARRLTVIYTPAVSGALPVIDEATWTESNAVALDFAAEHQALIESFLPH